MGLRLALCAIAILLPMAITGWMRPAELVVEVKDCASKDLIIRDLGAELGGLRKAHEKCILDTADMHEQLVACGCRSGERTR